MKTSLASTNNQFPVTRAASNANWLSLIRTTRLWRIVRRLVWIMSLLWAGSTDAQPLAIRVSYASYATFVSVGDGSLSRTTTSLTPVSDSIIAPPSDPLDPRYHNEAHGTADTFGVAVDTSGLDVYPGRARAHAWATSQIRFSPLVDQTQPLGIEFSRWGLVFFAGGSMTLSDLTSGSELLNYDWGWFPGTVPWDDSSYRHALVNQAVDFRASHQYELRMDVVSDAASDAEGTSVQVTGLEVEPSSVCLLLMAQVESKWPRSRPLIATLSAALASIDRGNSLSAVNQLLAFQNKVQAQVAPSNPALAASFIGAAQGVIDVLRAG